ALVNTACGAGWVSVHHGGGVGIGFSHHPGMETKTDAHAAAVMDAYPASAASSVDQGIQDGPVGDGVRAVLHPFRFAVGGSHRAGVEMIAANDDGGLQLSRPHHLVELQAKPGSFAVAQPADPRR